MREFTVGERRIKHEKNKFGKDESGSYVIAYDGITSVHHLHAL
ncbi:hypothetical protein NXZ84_13810 [Mechercharimyces sp. CAU 1602]|nr:hypothetical protein [Mechercharimyces sp. CAU 1602]MCS1352608.1 hypothetical protein [Mechercharimyces sp. CAU 1602]